MIQSYEARGACELFTIFQHSALRKKFEQSVVLGHRNRNLKDRVLNLLK